VENPTPAVVISVEAAHVDNPILPDYLTSEVALQAPVIRRTDPHILIDNNCNDDKLQFGMPGGSGDYEDDANECDEVDAIPTARRQPRPAIELQRFYLETSDVDGYQGDNGDDRDPGEEEEASQSDDVSTQNVEDWGHSRFDLGTSDVYGYEGKDGEDADKNDEEEASQADDGSTQNVADWGHTTRECEDWTLYFSQVKYGKEEATATASTVSGAKTVLQSVTISQS